MGGIKLAGDSAIRGQRPDPNVISASMVGSMLGSYVGQEAHDYIVSNHLDLQSWLDARTRQVPVASATSNAAARPVAADNRRSSKVSAIHAKKPVHATKRANNAEPFTDDTWVADEYARTRGYGYARNTAAFWNSRQNAVFMQQTSSNFQSIQNYILIIWEMELLVWLMQPILLTHIHAVPLGAPCLQQVLLYR